MKGMRDRVMKRVWRVSSYLSYIIRLTNETKVASSDDTPGKKPAHYVHVKGEGWIEENVKAKKSKSLFRQEYV